jgi:hypothetical protein
MHGTRLARMLDPGWEQRLGAMQPPSGHHQARRCCTSLQEPSRKGSALKGWRGGGYLELSCDVWHRA